MVSCGFIEYLSFIRATWVGIYICIREVWVFWEEKAPRRPDRTRSLFLDINLNSFVQYFISSGKIRYSNLTVNFGPQRWWGRFSSAPQLLPTGCKVNIYKTQKST